MVLDKRQMQGSSVTRTSTSARCRPPRRELTWRPLTPPPPSRDDSDDFVGSIFHVIQMAQQEGRQIELPEELTEDETTRLALLMAEMPQPPPPMRQYAVDLVPPGLSEGEASNLAFHDSVPPPSPPLPSWAPATAPPPPPGAPAYATPVPNWPWAIPNLVDLTQLPNDDED
jgi:hypothetical protein